MTASVGRPRDVLQKSVLGPIRFLKFINELANSTRNPRYLFADDGKVAGIDLEKEIETVITQLHK